MSIGIIPLDLGSDHGLNNFPLEPIPRSLTGSGIGRGNKSLVYYKNWPTGGALCQKLCFVWISSPASGPHPAKAGFGKKWEPKHWSV